VAKLTKSFDGLRSGNVAFVLDRHEDVYGDIEQRGNDAPDEQNL
jgi:hypothetical protein